MTHVVSENCIKCKYTDCVDVCPVDCFREGPNMLVIEEDLPADQIAFIKLNADLAFADGWKSITKRKPALPDADEWNGKPGKINDLIR